MRMIRQKILILAFITWPSFLIASEPIQIKSNIIFNTSCARCHEGECSGRMTFHLPKNAADQHILRHGGELPAETVQELFELLRYMKEECSFYPFSFALIKDRVWNSDTLAQFHAPSNKAYFLPLGHLQPGSYQLLFQGFNSTSNICAEIINSEFDFIKKEGIQREGKQRVLQFTVEERFEHFLRITADEPISLKQLELLPQKTSGIGKTN